MIGSTTGEIRLFSAKMWEENEKAWSSKQYEGVGLVQGDAGKGGKLHARTK